MFLLFTCGPAKKSGLLHPGAGAAQGAVESYVQGTDIGAARLALEKAAAAAPGDPLVLYLLADTEYLQGDFDAATLHLARALAGAAARADATSDVIGQLSLPTIETMGRYVAGYEEILRDAVDASIDDLRAHADGAYFTALFSRVKQLRRAGKYEEAAQAAREGGCLSRWIGTGSFGETELLDFDTVFPPEVEVPWREAYEGVAGGAPLPVSPAVAEGCWTTLGDETASRGGTLYGMTRLVVPGAGGAAREVVFRLTAFDPASLLVDGVELLRVDRRTRAAANFTLVRASLAPGAHYVVVKLSSRNPAPSFSLAVKPAAGTAAPLSSELPGHGDIPLAPPPLAHAVVEHDLPEGDAGALLMTDYDISRGFAAQARRSLEPARAGHPDSFAVLSRAINVEGLDYSLPYSTRAGRNLALAARLRELHPSIWFPAIFESQLLQEKGRPQEAVAVLEEGMRQSPLYKGFVVDLAGVYDQLGWDAECVETLGKAAALLGGTCLAHRLRFQLASKQGDEKGMEEAARLLFECDRGDWTYVDLLAGRKQWEKALALQLGLLAGYEGSRGLMLDAAWGLFKAGRIAEYVELTRAAWDKYPGAAMEAHRFADVSKGKLGDGAAATDAIFAALAGTQGQATLAHQKVAVLNDWPFFMSFRRSFEEAVAAFDAGAAKGVSYGATPAVEVLDHVTHRVYENGSSLSRYHSIRKLLTREGIERNGEFKVPDGAALLKLRTVKPDGSVREPQEIGGKPTISYPSLEPGDFTETEWVQYEPPASVFPGGTFLDRWYFQVPDLVLHRSEMYLVAPAGMELDFNPRGAPPAPQVREENGLKIYAWVAEQVPHVRGEPNAPALNEFLPSVQASRGVTWERYFGWVRDQLLPTFIVTDEMARKVKELAEGIPAGRDEEIAAAVYRWVCDELDEQEGLGVPVSHIFHEKRGTRARLLYALLGEAGVPAELHVAETLYADETETKVPDYDRYTHFVVFTGKTWLLPAVRNAYYGYLPDFLAGRKTVRLFPGPGEGALPAAKAGEGGATQELSMSVGPDGTATARLTLVFKGPRAALMRSAVSNIPAGDRTQQIETLYLAENFTGATLTGVATPDLAEAAPRFTLVIDFTMPLQQGPAPGTVVAGPLLKSNVAAVWTPLPERAFPLLVDEETTLETRIEIKGGGGGWRVVLPPKMNVSAAAGVSASFDQKTTVPAKGDTLTVERKLTLHAGRVPPAKYGQLLSFAGKVEETEGGVYLLVPGG